MPTNVKKPSTDGSTNVKKPSTDGSTVTFIPFKHWSLQTLLIEQMPIKLTNTVYSHTNNIMDLKVYLNLAVTTQVWCF